jgi:hypothetical protein
MTKRIANKVYFLTTDLGNFETARELALGAGLELELLFPKDLPLPADARALVVDLDYLCLDANGRRDFVQRLPVVCEKVPVALHSYDKDALGVTEPPLGPIAKRLSVRLLQDVAGTGGDNRRAA